MSKKIEIDHDEGVKAKRGLQDALDRLDRIGAKWMPGPVKDQINLIHRGICLGVTALRDVDKVAFEYRSGGGTQEPWITLTCKKCGAECKTRSEISTRCKKCDTENFVSVKAREKRLSTLKRRKKA